MSKITERLRSKEWQAEKLTSPQKWFNLKIKRGGFMRHFTPPSSAEMAGKSARTV
jgi:hypothetical protein